MEHKEEEEVEEDGEARRIQQDEEEEEDQELRVEMQKVSRNGYREKVRRRFSAAGSQ